MLINNSSFEKQIIFTKERNSLFQMRAKTFNRRSENGEVRF
jgi:hypothetical protein